VNECYAVKRHLIFILVIFFVLIPLSAKPLGISLLGTVMDAADTKSGLVVDLDGEQVFLGKSTLGSLKKTFKAHDFLQLPFEQRSELYEGAHVPTAWPVAKNFLVGGGSGSKLQGDVGGRLFGQIADWTAATTIGVGLGVYLVDLFFVQIFTGGGNSSSINDDSFKDFALDTMKVGAIFLLAERVVQAILPIPFALRYNKTLRNGLGINKNGSDMIPMRIALVPVAVMNINHDLAMQVVGRVSIAL